MADSEVANALCNNAVHSNNVAAQIWRSKAGMRWSETLGRCPLTIRRQIDILQSGPGWEGTEYNSINSDGARSSRCSAARRARGRSRRAQQAGMPVVGFLSGRLSNVAFQRQSISIQAYG